MATVTRRMWAALTLSIAMAAITASAGAGTTTWVGNTGNWDVGANWDSGVPGAGDEGIINNTATAWGDAVANSTLAGDPQIRVTAGGFLTIQDNVALGFKNQTTVENGATLGVADAYYLGTGITLEDGATLSGGTGVGGQPTNEEIALPSGTVTFTRTLGRGGGFTLRPKFTGHATVEFYTPFDGTTDTWALTHIGANAELVGGSIVGFDGDMVINSGGGGAGNGAVLIRCSGVRDGVLTGGDVTVKSGAELRLINADGIEQPFGGVVGENWQPGGVSTTTLTIEAGGTYNIYYGNPDNYGDTVEGMVLGGTVVPAGIYTVAELRATYGNSYFNTNGTNNSYTFEVLPEPAILGDVNGDGVVDGLDIQPFVDLLTGGGYQTEADINEDSVVDGLDIQPFVDIITGAGGNPVPEPATMSLLVVAGIGMLVRRGRH